MNMRRNEIKELVIGLNELKNQVRISKELFERIDLKLDKISHRVNEIESLPSSNLHIEDPGDNHLPSKLGINISHIQALSIGLTILGLLMGVALYRYSPIQSPSANPETENKGRTNNSR